MPSQTEIRQQITNRIIEAIEKNNILPWRRPWKVCAGKGRPFNVASGKPYTGINPILLQLHAMEHKLCTGAWATFKQWQDLGCRCRRRRLRRGVPSRAWRCGSPTWNRLLLWRSRGSGLRMAANGANLTEGSLQLDSVRLGRDALRIWLGPIRSVRMSRAEGRRRPRAARRAAEARRGESGVTS